MKIYDISQEVFSCAVFPGDPAPRMSEDMRMERGDLYNLTSLSMCAHNGTHIDAPFHFIKCGKTVEQIPLDVTVGIAYVAQCSGELTAQDAMNILLSAESCHVDSVKRILIKGDAVVSLEAAEVFATSGVVLVGVEPQTVGPADAPAEVHRLLLGSEVVLLEGLRLSEVPEDAYLLNAAPLNLTGCDGAPCRAILVGLKREKHEHH